MADSWWQRKERIDDAIEQMVRKSLLTVMLVGSGFATHSLFIRRCGFDLLELQHVRGVSCSLISGVDGVHAILEERVRSYSKVIGDIFGLICYIIAQFFGRTRTLIRLLALPNLPFGVVSLHSYGKACRSMLIIKSPGSLLASSFRRIVNLIKNVFVCFLFCP